ncbi:MAG: hypothetical protein ABEI98_01990, partial [Halorhabdus sp.]
PVRTSTSGSWSSILPARRITPGLTPSGTRLVRLEDEVGGARVEQMCLWGEFDHLGFVDRYDWTDDEGPAVDGELVVFPAFNELSSGTWVNVDGQDFLSSFLPQGLTGGEAYMLDGTWLGPYDLV